MVELSYKERKKGIILDKYDYRDNFDELVSSVNYKTKELKKTDDLSKFVHKCKGLGKYLDNHRKECIKCYEGEFVQSDLNFYSAIDSLLSEVTNYGGCPRHWSNKDDERINLIRELNKFCKQKDGYKNDLRKLGTECREKTKCNKTEICNTKQLGYKQWLHENQKHFSAKQSIIDMYFSGPNPKIKLSYDCNTANSTLFEDNTNYCSKCVTTKSAPNDVAKSQYFVTEGISNLPADDSRYVISEESDLNYTSQKYGLGNVLYYGDIFGYDEHDGIHTVTLKDSSCTDNTYDIVQEPLSEGTQTVHDTEVQQITEMPEMSAASKISEVSVAPKITDSSEPSEQSEQSASSVSSPINDILEAKGPYTLYHYSKKQFPPYFGHPEPSMS
ncbi:VIR protein [Plasmodium vivax]|uniref:VIR protein n=2 Tax=Plasmodium vivax TaxID=5855 RepID=A0A1G4EIW3_PLAVI|nr:VIR protein [Plasmodium vivax]